MPHPTRHRLFRMLTVTNKQTIRKKLNINHINTLINTIQIKENKQLNIQQKQNYPDSVASYDTQPGNEVGLSYNGSEHHPEEELYRPFTFYQALIAVTHAQETSTGRNLHWCTQQKLCSLIGRLCLNISDTIHWSQHVINAEISARTGSPPVMDFIRRRRLSVFGHIARLTLGTPAHNALHCQVGLASGCSLGRDWRRRPGRPRALWTDQLRNDTGSVPANLWKQTGHSTGPWWSDVMGWSDVMARAGYAMTTTTIPETCTE